LIRDLDNPFDYNGESQVGAAEVSLEPLDYLERGSLGMSGRSRLAGS
jgi:hypothetical protein